MSTQEEPVTLRSIIDKSQERGDSTYETIKVYGEKYAPETYAHAPIRESLSREHRLRKEIANRRARGQPPVPEFHISAKCRNGSCLLTKATSGNCKLLSTLELEFKAG